MQNEKAALTIETVLISSLKPHPRNYVKHPEDQLQHIIHSIEQHGFYRNIIVARDGTILAGHGVIEAARRMGLTEAPVHRIDLDPSHPSALKVVVGDNEIQHMREVDDRTLTGLLKDIGEASIDGLLGTGYDEAMVASLLIATRTSAEIPNIDAAADWASLGELPPSVQSKDVRRISVYFHDEKGRDEFMAFIGADKLVRKVVGIHGSTTGTIWWPIGSSPKATATPTPKP